jgi:hypothetical protein
MWARLACFAIACLALCGAARAAPTDPDRYTAHVAKLLAAEAPDLSVTVRERLSLDIAGKVADENMFANLDRVWEFCRRNEPDCDSATETYVRNMAAMLKERLRPLERAMVRVVVRPRDYVEQIRKTFMEAPNAKPGTEPVLMLFAGDLWLVCVADLPSSVRVLSRGDLEKLGLTIDEAIALGQRNVGAGLQPTSDAVQVLPPQGFGFIEGNDYESSRILFHGEWAQIAASMKGDLIVAVPGSGLTVYGDSGQPDAAPAMAAFARYAMGRMERPISASLFRWTPAGWEPISVTP